MYSHSPSSENIRFRLRGEALRGETRVKKTGATLAARGSRKRWSLVYDRVKPGDVSLSVPPPPSYFFYRA